MRCHPTFVGQENISWGDPRLDLMYKIIGAVNDAGSEYHRFKCEIFSDIQDHFDREGFITPDQYNILVSVYYFLKLHETMFKDLPSCCHLEATS